MALFGKKQNTAKKEVAAAPASSSASASHARKGKKHSNVVLVSPRITEKGAYLAEQNAYVFNVSKKVTKREIAAAIELIFKVKPIKINVAAVPAKKISSRLTGAVGVTNSGRKAVVFLKKGDTIEIA